MSDHPVLIPTSFGPVEGTVSEPDGERRAALVLTQANGRAGRWGTNAVWTRTARELSQRGVVVLRADYARGTDGGTAGKGRAVLGQTAAQWERDLAVRQEIAEWFGERVGSPELMMAGICRGARVAIHVAARNSGVSRLLLIAPPVLDPGKRGHRLLRRLMRRRHSPEMRIDPTVAADLSEVVERIPVTMICAEREAAFLGEVLGDPFALDLIPGPRLSRMESPEVQAATVEHTVRWASRPLAERAIA